MIYLFGVAFLFAACSANIVDNPSNENNSALPFFFVGDDDEELTLIDSNEEIDEEFIRSYTGDPDNHGYFLFTRGNPINPQILRYKNESTIENSNFNKDKVTVFLSHGWNGNWLSGINRELTAAYLEVQDVNVIVLDWSALASKGYLTAVKGVPAVGRDLGQFIIWLVSLGASYEKHHILGFSLGGHVVGNAGRETGGKVKRITALDPAGPLWWSNSERLIKSDAQYVEVIHTSLVCGHITPCGDTDFYPNGGYLQPGCPCVPCSHSRSYKYMAASLIFNNFKANECKNMDEMLHNSCAGEIEIMGNGDLEPKRPGIYRLNTGSHYPYNVTYYSN